MNEILKAIDERRSYRDYDEERDVKEEDLWEIVKAGSKAPTAVNRQPLFFIAIKDKEIMAKLRAFLNGGKQFYNAPAVILSFKKQEDHLAELDLGASLQNMYLASQSLGLGSCWIHCMRDSLNTEEGRKFLQDLLSLDQPYEPCEALIVGYPRGEKPLKKEKDISLDKVL